MARFSLKTDIRQAAWPRRVCASRRPSAPEQTIPCDMSAAPASGSGRRGLSTDKARKRKNCPDQYRPEAIFPFCVSRACRAWSLRLCKRACLQVCFLILRAFSSPWQSVDVVNFLPPVSSSGRREDGFQPRAWLARAGFQRPTAKTSTMSATVSGAIQAW